MAEISEAFKAVLQRMASDWQQRTEMEDPRTVATDTAIATDEQSEDVILGRSQSLVPKLFFDVPNNRWIISSGQATIYRIRHDAVGPPWYLIEKSPREFFNHSAEDIALDQWVTLDRDDDSSKWVVGASPGESTTITFTLIYVEVTGSCFQPGTIGHTFQEVDPNTLLNIGAPRVGLSDPQMANFLLPGEFVWAYDRENDPNVYILGENGLHRTFEIVTTIACLAEDGTGKPMYDPSVTSCLGVPFECPTTLCAGWRTISPLLPGASALKEHVVYHWDRGKETWNVEELRPFPDLWAIVSTPADCGDAQITAVADSVKDQCPWDDLITAVNSTPEKDNPFKYGAAAATVALLSWDEGRQDYIVDRIEVSCASVVTSIDTSTCQASAVSSIVGTYGIIPSPVPPKVIFNAEPVAVGTGITKTQTSELCNADLDRQLIYSVCPTAAATSQNIYVGQKVINTTDVSEISSGGLVDGYHVDREEQWVICVGIEADKDLACCAVVESGCPLCLPGQQLPNTFTWSVCGITDGTCASCDSYNGAHELTKISECIMEGIFADPCGGATFKLTFSIIDDTTNILLRMVIVADGFTITFEKILGPSGTPVDCSAEFVTGNNIPWVSTVGSDGTCLTLDDTTVKFGTVPCTTECPDCTPGQTLPATIDLTICGITTGTCETCGDYNVTHELTQTAACEWGGTFVDPCGGANYLVTLEFINAAGTIFLEATITTDAFEVTYSQSLGAGPVDCLAALVAGNEMPWFVTNFDDGSCLTLGDSSATIGDDPCVLPVCTFCTPETGNLPAITDVTLCDFSVGTCLSCGGYSRSYPLVKVSACGYAGTFTDPCGGSDITVTQAYVERPGSEIYIQTDLITDHFHIRWATQLGPSLVDCTAPLGAGFEMIWEQTLFSDGSCVDLELTTAHSGDVAPCPAHCSDFDCSSPTTFEFRKESIADDWGGNACCDGMAGLYDAGIALLNLEPANPCVWETAGTFDNCDAGAATPTKWRLEITCDETGSPRSYIATLKATAGPAWEWDLFGWVEDDLGWQVLSNTVQPVEGCPTFPGTMEIRRIP